MEIKIEDTKIQLKIDIFDLLDSLSDEEKKQVVEVLSCHEAVIKHVTDQILDGYTDNGYCGAFATSSNEAKYLTELQKSRVRISESLSELAYEQIRMLKIKNQNLAQELENARQIQWNLGGNH